MNNKINQGFIPVIIILVVLIGIAGVYFYRPTKPQSIVESPIPTSQSPYVISDSKQIKYTCLDNEIYKSNYFGLEFVCQKGTDVIDSPEAMNISVSVYNWIWLTNTKIDKNIKDRVDKLNTLNEIDSLKRTENKSLFGISSKVFFDDKPYEGNPYFIYLIPKNGYYFYLQVMSPNPTDFDQILSTFKFID